MARIYAALYFLYSRGPRLIQGWPFSICDHVQEGNPAFSRAKTGAPELSSCPGDNSQLTFSVNPGPPGNGRGRGGHVFAVPIKSQRGVNCSLLIQMTVKKRGWWWIYNTPAHPRCREASPRHAGPGSSNVRGDSK